MSLFDEIMKVSNSATQARLIEGKKEFESQNPGANFDDDLRREASNRSDTDIIRETEDDTRDDVRENDPFSAPGIPGDSDKDAYWAAEKARIDYARVHNVADWQKTSAPVRQEMNKLPVANVAPPPQPTQYSNPGIIVVSGSANVRPIGAKAPTQATGFTRSGSGISTAAASTKFKGVEDMDREWLDEEYEHNRIQYMLSDNPKYQHDLGGVNFFNRIQGHNGMGEASSPSMMTWLPHACVVAIAAWYFMPQLKGFLK
jgi:hypothetical protein